MNQAHGLCFSVRAPTPAPPSLKNVYVALKRDYADFRPPPRNGGLLTPWADRGVLLLNTCLTVRAHEANSHAGKGWERLTQRVIDVVARERRDGVAFLAWGSPAQKRCAGVSGTRHLVLRSVHPSPLSAAKGFVSLSSPDFPSQVEGGPFQGPKGLFGADCGVASSIVGISRRRMSGWRAGMASAGRSTGTSTCRRTRLAFSLVGGKRGPFKASSTTLRLLVDECRNIADIVLEKMYILLALKTSAGL